MGTRTRSAWLVLGVVSSLLVLGVVDAASGSGTSVTALPPPVRVPGGKGTVVRVTCQTLQSALNQLRARQTVIVRGGPCAGQYNVIGKALARPAEIRGPFGTRVRFTGSDKTGYPALYVARSSNVVVGRNLELTNPVGPCVVVETSRDVRVLRAHIHDCGGQGVLVQSSDERSQSYNVQVDRNEIWSVGSARAGLEHGVDHRGAPNAESGYWRYGTHGIYFGGGRGVTTAGGAWNNYVHDQPTGYGIQVGGGAQGAVVASNTITRVTRDPRRDTPPTDAGRAGACIQVFSSFAGSRDVQVVNNVCTDAATRGIAGSCLCGPIGFVSNNVVWRNGVHPAIDAHYGGSRVFDVGVNWILDPRLDDDGRPALSSPLVRRADPRYLPIVDLEGRRRTTRTIGAFEAR